MWDVTMILLHIAVLGMLGSLCRHSPGFLSWVVLGCLIAANLIFVGTYASEALGDSPHWLVKMVAHRVEHVAIIIWAFRLFVIEQERRCLPTSSPSSPASQR